MASKQIDEWNLLRSSAESAFQRLDYPETERLWLSALELAEDSSSLSNRLAVSLENLAEVLWYQRKFAQAAPILRRLIRMYSENFGPGHFNVGIVANNMAMLYHAWGKLAKAEPFYLKALAIKRRSLGEAHPEVVTIISHYCRLLQELGRSREAKQLEELVRRLEKQAQRKTAVMMPVARSTEQLSADEKSYPVSTISASVDRMQFRP